MVLRSCAVTSFCCDASSALHSPFTCSSSAASAITSAKYRSMVALSAAAAAAADGGALDGLALPVLEMRFVSRLGVTKEVRAAVARTTALPTDAAPDCSRTAPQHITQQQRVFSQNKREEQGM
jgi:hypothetical protein